MKVTKFPKPLTKKYLRLAVVYRRFAGRTPGFDFSMQALLDCQVAESKGIKAQKNNGYVFGKWAKDISVATWREDIVAGHFCKAEFHTPCNKWWAEPALESVIVPAWFPFDVNTYTPPTTEKLLAEIAKCTKADMMFNYWNLSGVPCPFFCIIAESITAADKMFVAEFGIHPSKLSKIVVRFETPGYTPWYYRESPAPKPPNFYYKDLLALLTRS